MRLSKLIPTTVPNGKILTAILPVHNYLERRSAILNILNQVEPYVSVIQVMLIFSGSSPDNDWKLLGADKPNIPSIAAHRFLKNSSPGEARNLGISLCETPWITFWDDDDFPLVESILKVLLKLQPNKVLVGQYAVRDLCTQYMQNSKSSRSRTSLVMDGGIWRIMFPIDFIRHLKFPPLNLAEDRFFLLLVCTHFSNKHFIFSDELLYIYQRGTNSLMTKYTQEDAIKILDLLLKYWESKKGNPFTILLVLSLCISYFFHLPLKRYTSKISLQLFLKHPILSLWALLSILIHNVLAYWKLRS